MHPLIHLVSLLVFSLGLTLGQWSQLLLATALLPLYWMAVRQGPGLSGWRLIQRLRWFFLSILVVYLWFTPGHWVWPALGIWSPTQEGLELATHRLAVLVLIIMAVASLLRVLSLEQLMSALQQMLAPLARFGFPVERFALRLALTIQAGQLLLQSGASTPAPADASPRQKIEILAQHLWQHFQQAVTVQAEREIDIPSSQAPPWWQWGWPLALLAAFLSVN